MKKVVRKTKETRVEITLERSARPGLSEVSVTTGIPFYDHMLTTLLRYAGLDCKLSATGDLKHHVMEDVALTLGRAIRRAMPESAQRYGEKTIPMDDALVAAYLDAGGRFYFAGELPGRMYTHALRSLASALGATLHVRVLAGTNKHHLIEAGYKATGLALRQAISDAGGGVFSLKGSEEIVEDDG